MPAYNRLKVILNEKNISQDQLSREMKIAPANISRWCRNIAQPNSEMLYFLSRFLNVSQQELLYTKIQPIAVPLTNPLQEVDLAQLGVNDAFLWRVQGKHLQNVQGTIVQLISDFGDGNIKGWNIPLMASLMQNPQIPIIEANQIVDECKKTKLTLFNAKEDIEIWFLLPDKA